MLLRSTLDQCPNFCCNKLINWKGQMNYNNITFDVRVEPVMLIKFAPASVASALARRVFPVPGGPKSNIPLQGWNMYLQIYYTRQKKRTKLILLHSESIQETRTITRNRFPWEKSSGLLIGRITSSWSAVLTFSRAPMSSNCTPISPGGTTAEMKLLSNSSFARLCYQIFEWSNSTYKKTLNLGLLISYKKINHLEVLRRFSWHSFHAFHPWDRNFKTSHKGMNKQMRFKFCLKYI